jgi:hypothetical protein
MAVQDDVSTDHIDTPSDHEMQKNFYTICSRKESVSCDLQNMVINPCITAFTRCMSWVCLKILSGLT